jgi:predicted small integral membrane protein
VATVVWIVGFIAILAIMPSGMGLNQILTMTAFGAALLFVSDLCGNTIHLGHTFWNGMVSAIIWAALFVVISTLYQSLVQGPP